MTKNKLGVDASRRKVIDNAKDLLREIEIDFNTQDYWNNNVRKSDEAKLDYDADGKMAKIMDALAETLRLESVHRIPRAQWLTDIRRIAIEKFNLMEEAATKTDWQHYAHEYYLDFSPEDALKEDFSNQ